MGWVRAAELCARAAGEPEGARPASGGMDRGYAEATPQALACGVVAVLGWVSGSGVMCQSRGGARGGKARLGWNELRGKICCALFEPSP